MFLLIFTLVLALAVALLVAAFAAFPHRGESIPRAERLSSALMKVNDKLGL